VCPSPFQPSSTPEDRSPASACVDTIVDDYLISLTVPRSGMVCQ
jgi:hypothetical protein